MKFNKLSKKAKERAIEMASENIPDDWYEETLARWSKKLEKLGIYTDDIKFSGFGSQCDGLSFTGHVDILDYLKANKLVTKYKALYRSVSHGGRNYGNGVINITRISHNYYHDKTIDFNYPSEWVGSENEISDLERYVADDCRGYMYDMYKELEEESEWYSSDEAMEQYDNNFDEDGNIE